MTGRCPAESSPTFTCSNFCRTGFYHSRYVNRPSIQLILGAILCLVWVRSATAQSIEGLLKDKTVLAHYMPWYSSKPISGAWGWHWTMNRFNPDKEIQGQPSIASHFHPSIGPYDSSDNHALECQIQLMKWAGIDGVIIDWYGVDDVQDYAMIHRNTQTLIRHLDKAGLRFALCYEDQSLKHRPGEKDKAKALARAFGDFDWLSSECFKKKNYLRVQGKPVLPIFGPQYLKAEDWQKLRQRVDGNVILMGLPHLSKPNRLDGFFGWPPVHGGTTITIERWSRYLDDLEKRPTDEQRISICFPGFLDIYEQAGVGKSYGKIEFGEGATFEKTIRAAARSRANLVQIATWNDYGEGTNIEPTEEYGFRYLKMLRQSTGVGTPLENSTWNLPVRVYQARKAFAQDQRIQKRLDLIVERIQSGKLGRISEELETLQSKANKN